MKMYFPYIIAGLVLISVVFLIFGSIKSFKKVYNMNYSNNKNLIYIIIFMIILSIIIVFL